jgi:hypothetical protein
VAGKCDTKFLLCSTWPSLGLIKLPYSSEALVLIELCKKVATFCGTNSLSESSLNT